MKPSGRTRRTRRVPACGIRLELDDRGGRVLDLSELGMGIEIMRGFQQGQWLRAVLAAGGDRLPVEGRVCWCAAQGEVPSGDRASFPVYHAGISFQHPGLDTLRKGVLRLLSATPS
jgi:hypothetical protein